MSSFAWLIQCQWPKSHPAPASSQGQVPRRHRTRICTVDPRLHVWQGSGTDRGCQIPATSYTGSVPGVHSRTSFQRGPSCLPLRPRVPALAAISRAVMLRLWAFAIRPVPVTTSPASPATIT